MIPWLDRREAKERLVNINELIDQLGGEDHAAAQILGQRDMIEYELQFHSERCDEWVAAGIFMVFLLSVSAIFFLVVGKA